MFRREDDNMALTEKQKKFITDIAGYVVKYAATYGIAVHSPIIAQAILESGWGESRLSTEYHNYFGLKCGSKWTGRSVNMSTKEEYEPGVLTTIKDNFRAYDSMEEGVRGYFEFIQLARYQNLKGITDPKQYLQTIKDDGYATSSTYVENTYRLVIQHGLTEYDKEARPMKTRNAVVALAQSWVGKNENDGSFKTIIDTYNTYKPHPRGWKLLYTDEWCAGTVAALAIALGYTDIIPIECSCSRMIEIAKSMGIWVENDGYVPKPADFILYDWQDNGKGDNQGNPDHIGTVEKVNGNTITIIEGNYSRAVKHRELQVNGKYIRGYIVPKYDADGTQETPSQKKSVTEVAKEVLAGKWGNGDARKTALKNAGYDYDAVQAEVNRLAKGNTTAKKSVEEIAQEVIAGKWGNGDERKNRITAAGYDYNAVQKAINTKLSGSASKATKSVTEVAKEVIAGKWGNGKKREEKLTAAGYNYEAVQKKVNELLK